MISVLLLLTATFPTLFNTEIPKITCADLTPEYIQRLLDERVTQVHFTRSPNSGKRCFEHQNELQRKFMESLVYIQIDECPNNRYCMDLVANSKNIVKLDIKSAGLNKFDFGLIASKHLIEISLDGNEEIELKGISNANLTEFTCVGCKLNPLSVETLFQFRNSMIVLNLQGNDVDENFIRKQFPNAVVLFDNRTTSTTLPPPKKEDRNRSRKMYPCFIVLVILVCVLGLICNTSIEIS